MMRGLRTIWPFLLLSCFYCNFSEARHHIQKHPTAVVVGIVYCDTCFQDNLSKGSHYISGATVAVECAESKTRPTFYEEVKTDTQGNFKVHLPFSVSKHVKQIQGCTVKLIKSSEPYCSIASTATSSLIHLKEKHGHKHIYSAGFFAFKPLKQPGLCNQQPSLTKYNPNSLGNILPTIPTLPLPEIPTLPLPGVPPLPITNPLTPTIPGPPLLPNLPLPELPPLPPFSERIGNGLISQSEFLFPPVIPPVISPPSSGLPFPNPFQPPPGLLPNPFQPPPSPLIPNPFQPPPSPPPGLLPGIPSIPGIPRIPSIPGIPGVTQPPPSPPPPASFLPPLLPPGFPGFPGFPPPRPNKINP